jgi:hypothetical protein
MKIFYKEIDKQIKKTLSTKEVKVLMFFTINEGVIKNVCRGNLYSEEKSSA